MVDHPGRPMIDKGIKNSLMCLADICACQRLAECARYMSYMYLYYVSGLGHSVTRRCTCVAYMYLV